MDKSIYFLTGASGAGKTTLLDHLAEKYADKPWAFLHFDSVGVPAVEEMTARYGSPSGWQEAMTHYWIDRAVRHQPEEKVFIEGQVNLNFIRQGFQKHQFTNYRIALIDCEEDEMARRLTHDRNQSELLTPDMRNWLKYLRNQALEFNAPIINTTQLILKETALAFGNIFHL